MTIQFNNHQLRLWKLMLRAVDFYIDGKTDLSELIGSLEGALDAGEFKDKNFVKRWYDFWKPLEIYYAIKLDEEKPVIKEEIIKDVKSMRIFLMNQLEVEIKANPDLNDA